MIVSLRRDPDFFRDLERFRARGIGVHIVPMQRRIAPLADFLALGRITCLLRQLRPDVVHTHSSKAGFLGRLAARRAGIRTTVHTPHAFAFEDTSAPLRGRCYRALERMAIPWTTRLIAVSEHERELALALGFAAEQVVQVANGIEVNAQLPIRSSTLDLPSSVPTVTFLARLCRQKAPDLFLAAIPEILAQVPAARFRIAGEGPWRKWTEQQVARQVWRDRVTFGVAHTEAEVAQELAAATVLAMPSRWEGLPYTLLEALQAGTPVVVADVGGVRDVVADTTCAVLVPPNHPGMLAAGVAGLLRSPAERARLATAGRGRVKVFGVQRMIDETAAVYRACFASGGRRKTSSICAMVRSSS